MSATYASKTDPGRTHSTPPTVPFCAPCGEGAHLAGGAVRWAGDTDRFDLSAVGSRQRTRRSFHRTLAATATALVVVGLVTGPAGAIGTTERVSLNNGGGQATGSNADSSGPSMSSDGRYVAFTNFASLSPLDSNSAADVYVRDRLTGTTELVSVGLSGNAANDSSAEPSISGDGRYVAFWSFASDLVGGDTNGFYDEFVHDRLTGTTQRISLSTTGAEAGYGQQMLHPEISADGSTVVFATSASLDPADTGSLDIYLRDLTTNTTQWVSVTSAGVSTPGEHAHPSVSGDGRYVVFQSDSTHLVPGSSGYQIFRWDRLTGAIESVSADTTAGFRENIEPSISDDGQRVAFYSRSGLVPEDTDTFYDVYFRDLSTSALTRLSVASDGGTPNGHSSHPVISGDGTAVAFYSQATNLVPGDGNDPFFGDVFLRRLAVPDTQLVDVSSGGAQSNFMNSADISLSADGTRIAFGSGGTTLVTPDANNSVSDIYVRDITPPPPPSTVSGHVTDELAAALPNVSVTAFGQTSGQSFTATTAGDGTYLFANLPPDTYRVRFVDPSGTHLTEWWNNRPNSPGADLVVVGASVNVTAIDAALTAGVELPHVTSITGVVTDALGTPLAGISVFADSLFSNGATVTAGDGTYTIAGIAAGTYNVQFSDYGAVYSREYWHDQTSIDTATPVVVVDGDVTSGIDAALEQTSISGTVTDSLGGPLAGIIVAAGGQVAYGSTVTAADGTYTITGLNTDTVTVQFFDYSAVYWSEYWINQASVDTATPLTLTRGTATPNINATLEQTSISGRVTNGSGQPIAGISVAALGVSSYGSTFTAADGTYTITGLNTDTYSVQFYDYTGTYSGETWNDQASLDTATPLTLTAAPPPPTSTRHSSRPRSPAASPTAPGNPSPGSRYRQAACSRTAPPSLPPTARTPSPASTPTPTACSSTTTPAPTRARTGTTNRCSARQPSSPSPVARRPQASAPSSARPLTPTASTRGSRTWRPTATPTASPTPSRPTSPLPERGGLAPRHAGAPVGRHLGQRRCVAHTSEPDAPEWPPRHTDRRVELRDPRHRGRRHGALAPASPWRRVGRPLLQAAGRRLRRRQLDRVERGVDRHSHPHRRWPVRRRWHRERRDRRSADGRQGEPRAPGVQRCDHREPWCAQEHLRQRASTLTSTRSP